MTELTINEIPNLIQLSAYDILISLFVSIVSGFIVSFCYQKTHSGLSYSQTFVHSIVLTSFISALVVMVIGTSLTRAFALVGALSIIRYRTVLKDTKDLSFIFASLVFGLASGISNYLLVSIGLIVFCILVYFFKIYNYGSLYKTDFILNFRYSRKNKTDQYIAILDKYCKNYHLLNMEPSSKKDSNFLTYDLTLIDNKNAQAFMNELSDLNGVNELTVVTSKNDLDY